MDDKKTLDFIRSYTIEQFKDEMKTEKIQVLHQKDTPNKLFFSWGPDKTQVGAVSKSGIPAVPIISLVKSKTDGKSFYLMHAEGEGPAVLLTTF